MLELWRDGSSSIIISAPIRMCLVVLTPFLAGRRHFNNSFRRPAWHLVLDITIKYRKNFINIVFEIIGTSFGIRHCSFNVDG